MEGIGEIRKWLGARYFGEFNLGNNNERIPWCRCVFVSRTQGVGDFGRYSLAPLSDTDRVLSGTISEFCCWRMEELMETSRRRARVRSWAKMKVGGTACRSKSGLIKTLYEESLTPLGLHPYHHPPTGWFPSFSSCRCMYISVGIHV